VKVRVTAAILRRGDRLLLAQRDAPDYLAGKWELPGGKIEADESPEACLARELREELGVETRVGRFLGKHVHAYEQITVELLAFEVELVSGEPQPRVHRALAWVERDDLDGYELAPADEPLIPLMGW